MVHPVLTPLTVAGLTARVRPDGRLTVYPEGGITPLLDAYVRSHRAALIAALSPLPDGLKHAWCPQCRRHAVVLAPADPDVLCARCTLLWQPQRRDHSRAEYTTT
jgi:hypothetical protein